MQRDINEIEKVLNKHIDKLVSDYEIKLIYIFGSYAKGENRADSDLDIAMYFDSEVDGFIKLDILDELVGIFNREDIDLVILNNVDEVLKFQVIKYGKVVYMEDLVTKVTFESRVMREYMDMEYFREVRNKYSHKRFLEVMNDSKDYFKK
ncbi:MAG TPA: nucleotidyltransferase domain-containing protein [Clostridiales bacterium]|nr:nucleotidyltransferase domain-containing protein [Clostridiales bacterium]